MSNRISQDRLAKALHDALTWSEFVDRMQVNKDRIEENFRAHQLTASDRAVLSRLPCRLTVLALVHDWCGDVAANLPILARFEEAGYIKLAILEKNPHNTDLGLLYPHRSGEVHIPIYIAYDDQLQEQGHFIERSARLDALMASWTEEFWQKNSQLTRAAEFSQLEESTKTQLLLWLNNRRNEVRDQERSDMAAWLSEGSFKK
ncbi:MAG: hypothetical protein HKM05_04050 [Spirochaetales bacterium]|nr:hypothetical protein [Spirochaetales bacterium]